jgi:hypothetical protein
MELIYLAEGRDQWGALVNTVMDSIKGVKFHDRVNVSYSRRTLLHADFS